MDKMKWKDRSHQVDIVLILNLEDRYDRLWTVYGALIAAGTPRDMIRRWSATPGSDFENIEAFVDAATEDGFPDIFTHLLELEKEVEIDDRCMSIQTQFWNYSQMLRYLRDTNQTGVILYDDRYIKDWNILAETYHFLRESQPDNACLILQLDYYHSLYSNQKQALNPIRHHDVRYIVEGPTSANDNAMLYTAEGAEFLLNKILAKRDYYNMETTIDALSYLPREDNPDFWSVDIGIVETIGFGSNIDPNNEFNKPGSISIMK